MGVYVRIVPMQKPYGRSVPRNRKEASMGTFRPKSGKFIKEDRRDQLFVTNVNQIQYRPLDVPKWRSLLTLKRAVVWDW